MLDFMPENSAILIKINDFDRFESDLKNNGFLTKIETSPIYKSVLEQVGHLSDLPIKSTSLLAFSELGQDNYEYTLVNNDSTNLFPLEDLTEAIVEPIVVEGQSVYKITLGEEQLYGARYRKKNVISSSTEVLANLFRYFEQPKDFGSLRKLYAVSNSPKSASVFLNPKEGVPLFGPTLGGPISSKLEHFSDWVVLDLELGQHRLSLNGVSVSQDSVKQYLNLFRGTHPLAPITPSYAPRGTDAIVSYTFDDYTAFAKNRQHFLGLDIAQDSLLNTLEEIGHIYQNGKKAILLNTYGSEKIADYLTGLKVGESEYGGNQIFELGNSEFLVDRLSPLGF